MSGRIAIVTGGYLTEENTVDLELTIPIGGASGIGLAMVQLLAQTPEHCIAHVSILDVNNATGKEVTETLSNDFPKVTFGFHVCDVTSWELQAEVFEAIHAKHGRIDIVCANAGIPETGSFFTTTGDKPVKPDLKTYDVDLTGAMYSKYKQYSPVFVLVIIPLRSGVSRCVLYQ